eukprot:267905-Rhodomonas_salina.1
MACPVLTQARPLRSLVTRDSNVSSTFKTVLHPKVKYKKPHFQYNLYQERGTGGGSVDGAYCRDEGQTSRT